MWGKDGLPVYPEIAVVRPPDPVRCAIEIYGLPDQWEMVGAEVHGGIGQSTEYTLYEGAVYSKTLFGERDFKNPQEGTERKLALPTVIYRNWLAQWERETGYCYKCQGSGLEKTGWSAKAGTRYCSCDRCKATGESPQSTGGLAA